MNDDLSKRLDQAISRGRQRSKLQDEAQRQQELSAEELKRLHSQYRLGLSEQIEKGIEQVVNHFPGFRRETLYGDAGWGAACWRDNLAVEQGRRTSQFSRLELVIRPINEYFVLDLKGKGTVANKELFNRSHFMPLQEVALSDFEQLIDTWIVQYAEMYAAKNL